MRSFTENKDGVGNGPSSDLINRMLERFKELQFYDSLTIEWEQTTRGVKAHVRNPSFGGVGASGIPWQTPYKELDPTVAVVSGTWVYISPQNPMVTTGLVDAVAGGSTVVKAPSGIWQAVKDVPAKNGSNQYNVPVTPASGATSGTPLKGDYDAATLFWIPINAASYC